MDFFTTNAVFRELKLRLTRKLTWGHSMVNPDSYSVLTCWYQTMFYSQNGLSDTENSQNSKFKLKCRSSRLDSDTLVHPAPRAIQPSGRGVGCGESGVTDAIFIYDSWGLFTQNKFGRKSHSQGSDGGPRSGTVKKFFWTCLRKNFNCGQYMDDKNNFFCKTNFR